VTLVVTINGPETIWLLADRRLSFKDRPPKDDARKVMFLETTDGVAILGYAGLGVTGLGTEPADREAMKKQFPRLLHGPCTRAAFTADNRQHPERLL